MLEATVLRKDFKVSERAVPIEPLKAEIEFYQAYEWSLNAHPTVEQALSYLKCEIDRLGVAPSGWQREEVATNVFLLSCGILNCVDEYLRGPTLRLPSPLGSMRIGRCTKWIAEGLLGNKWSRSTLRRWRDQWLCSVDDFLAHFVRGHAAEMPLLVESAQNLAKTFRLRLPLGLRGQQLSVPTPFRRLDLTHFDVLTLGNKCIERFPDQASPLLLIGLRTSGSYFAPLLQALFKSKGYVNVSLVTLEPNKGPGRWESKELRRYAERGYTALIVDDPPQTAGAVFAAFEIARRAGFASDRLRAVVPTHLARNDWFRPLQDDLLISHGPEQWHKRTLLESQFAERLLSEYYGSVGFTRVTVAESRRTEKFNASLQNTFSDDRGVRLKQVFEVHLEAASGGRETRFVLAKSVGWGWLGYHAFLAARQLADYIPPILGLRDGILYMEWMPQAEIGQANDDRNEQIKRYADYVAARVRRLSVKTTVSGKYQQRHENGIRILSKALSRAYGGILADTLMRARLAKILRSQACPFPTLIDGNMQPAEWIQGPMGLLKTDFEHHGMGKTALNVVDPAYDLADTILNFELSEDEERELLRRYVQQCGDADVEERLFLFKLLAGIWSMYQAQDNLFGKACTAERQRQFHKQFMRAWNFLTVQAARHCGHQLQSRSLPQWHAPLVALDIDGVIDRRLFGFPSTTAAGILAFSALQAQQLSVVVNTARSVSEVKDYCQAYSLSGGIAEHGSYVWDAIARRGKSLISAETMHQLDKLSGRLREMPGVFLDDRHQYSIRAFTYQDKPQGLLSTLIRSLRSASIGDGALTPLPPLVIRQLLEELGLDRLRFHQTAIDTTIVAKDADKGTGLAALRDLVLEPEAQTIAVGDHEQDLSMFRIATKAFAPANLRCRRQARLIGCKIVRGQYQNGLVEIARAIASLAVGGNSNNVTVRANPVPKGDLFFSLLRVADRSYGTNLVTAVLNRSAYRIFVR